MIYFQFIKFLNSNAILELFPVHVNKCRINAFKSNDVLQRTPPSSTEGDENYFCKKKNDGRGNQPRRFNAIWVFGLVERVPRNQPQQCWLEEVPDRSANTLLPIIQRQVRQRRRVLTGSWVAYRRLPNLGYIHATVNHTHRFVDVLDLTCHINTIEGL